MPSSRAVTTLAFKELTPALWPALERLFGDNGACGGCWCMWWRIEAGERYEDVKGPNAKPGQGQGRSRSRSR